MSYKYISAKIIDNRGGVHFLKHTVCMVLVIKFPSLISKVKNRSSEALPYMLLK